MSWSVKNLFGSRKSSTGGPAPAPQSQSQSQPLAIPSQRLRAFSDPSSQPQSPSPANDSPLHSVAHSTAPAVEPSSPSSPHFHLSSGSPRGPASESTAESGRPSSPNQSLGISAPSASVRSPSPGPSVSSGDSASSPEASKRRWLNFGRRSSTESIDSQSPRRLSLWLPKSNALTASLDSSSSSSLQLSLDHILSLPVFQRAFHSFLCQKLCQENLEFLLDVMELRKSKQQKTSEKEQNSLTDKDKEKGKNKTKTKSKESAKTTANAAPAATRAPAARRMSLIDRPSSSFSSPLDSSALSFFSQRPVRSVLEIYSLYCTLEGDSTVNLNGFVLKQLEARLKNPESLNDPSVFDDAFNEIRSLLERNWLASFQAAPEYDSALNSLLPSERAELQRKIEMEKRMKRIQKQLKNGKAVDRFLAVSAECSPLSATPNESDEDEDKVETTKQIAAPTVAPAPKDSTLSVISGAPGHRRKKSAAQFAPRRASMVASVESSQALLARLAAQKLEKLAALSGRNGSESPSPKLNSEKEQPSPSLSRTKVSGSPPHSQPDSAKLFQPVSASSSGPSQSRSHGLDDPSAAVVIDLDAPESLLDRNASTLSITVTSPDVLGAMALSPTGQKSGIARVQQQRHSHSSSSSSSMSTSLTQLSVSAAAPPPSTASPPSPLSPTSLIAESPASVPPSHSVSGVPASAPISPSSAPATASASSAPRALPFKLPVFHDNRKSPLANK